jgi:GNAT superfamily N-acetyltransferase
MATIESTALRIRRMSGADPSAIAVAFASIGWSRSKPMSRFEEYLREQNEGHREVLVAVVGSDFAGYVTVNWESRYPPFAAGGVPEVQDLNVLPVFRARGIGTQLVDEAEQIAAKRSLVVGIGVGLHPGYNVAQRMYVKRGYVPDGRGVTFRDVFVQEGQSVVMDDDLVLHLVKWMVPRVGTG